MIVQADLMVRDTLRGAFAYLRENPDLLRQMLEGRPDDEATIAERWFSSNEVLIRLGFPSTPVELPGIYVQKMGHSEPQLNQVMGSVFGTEKVGDRWEDTYGTFFQDAVRCMCLSGNADLTVWISMVVEMALLAERDRDLNDISEQVLSTSDFEVAPELVPPPAYRRDVVLMGKTEATIARYFPSLREIGVTARLTIPTTEG